MLSYTRNLFMGEGDEYYKLKSHFLLVSASDSDPGGMPATKSSIFLRNLPSPIIARVFTQASHVVYNFYWNTSWGRYKRDCINNTQV